jgi:hypothetical protein
MNTIIRLDKLRTIAKIVYFLDGAQTIVFTVASSRRECYALAEKILTRFSDAKLARRDKGVVIRFLLNITSYSRQQLAPDPAL